MSSNNVGASRSLLPHERVVLDAILSQDFVGKETLMRQVEAAQVLTVDDEGSIRFIESAGDYAPIKLTVPLEAFYADPDGMTVYASLHVDATGKLVELEFYRGDGKPILSQPTKETIKLY